MSAPRVQRDGDVFVVTWDEQEVGIGVERFAESRDGLHAEVTVESTAPGFDGHVIGPVRLNLLSTQSHNTLAKACGERINHVDWPRMVSEASAIVTELWRRPPPLVNLATRPDPGPVKMLLPGIPLGETTVFYGDGESGKSLIVLLIALACNAGIVLPWAASVDRPLKVMYLDWETTEDTVNSRYRRICRGYGLTEIPALYYRSMEQSLAESIDVLRTERDREHIDVFIEDSISYACGNGSLSEDDVARAAMNANRRLGPATTRIGIAHMSQESARAQHGPVAPFGSRFFWNSMRSGWEVRRAEDSPTNTLELGFYHRKANDAGREKPFGLRVRFDGQQGPITFCRSELADVPDLIGRTSLPTRIRAILRAGAQDTKQLAEETGATEATIRSAVRRMDDVMQVAPGGGGGTHATSAQWGLRQ